MKFKIYDKESKIYDLLQFPRILYAVNNIGKFNDDPESTMEEMNNEAYVNITKRISEKLEPYKEEIDAFYANEFFSSYDYFMLLTDQYSFFGYDTIDSYLDYLMTIPNEKMKLDFIYALISADLDEKEPEEVICEKAKNMVASQGELTRFVKELPTDSSYKWNILMMLEDPNKTLKRFYTLIKQLEPIFENYYQESIEQIAACKQTLNEIFKDETLDRFLDVTQNMVSKEIFYEENKFLISFTFAYTFLTRETRYGNFFIWGTEMEEGFKRLSKRYEDKIMKTTKVFKLLGDKTRYEVLKLIASGISSTKVIATQLGVTSATISYHINSFVTNNVIKPSTSKKFKYTVNFELLDQLWNDLISDLKQE